MAKASGAEVRTEAYKKSSLASASLGGGETGINLVTTQTALRSELVLAQIFAQNA
jgi:hypothetical protein